MEAANVAVVPAIALVFGFPRDLPEALAVGLAIVATAGFLVVGAAFWRGSTADCALRTAPAGSKHSILPNVSNGRCFWRRAQQSPPR